MHDGSEPKCCMSY